MVREREREQGKERNIKRDGERATKIRKRRIYLYRDT